MATECNEQGTSLKTGIYIYSNNKAGNFALHAAGDANVQTIKSLRLSGPRTFKDELHTIIDSWRLLYGKLPWAELANAYGQGVGSIASKIEKLRKNTNLKVNFCFNLYFLI